MPAGGWGGLICTPPDLNWILCPVDGPALAKETAKTSNNMLFFIVFLCGCFVSITACLYGINRDVLTNFEYEFLTMAPTLPQPLPQVFPWLKSQYLSTS